MKYASLGSISHGTMREEDLLGTFADELEDHVQRNAEAWCIDEGRAQRGNLLAIVNDARETLECLENGEPRGDDAPEVLETLFDALQTFAPPYVYFGAHPGDGSDYGYWVSEGLEDEFDGLKVSDLSEVPDDHEGEVLHVNDHGNVSLYVADGKGGLSEVWAVV